MRRIGQFSGQALMVLIGTVISALAFSRLIIPNQMLSGGVAGFTLIINRLTGWPAGTMLLLINIPILILGYRQIGGRFILLTILAVTSFSLLLDLLPAQAAVDDRLLAAVFGGAMNGIGLGLVLRAGGSTGGTDIIGVVLNRRYAFSVGEVLLYFNGLIVAASALLFDLDAALYTLIAMFVTSRVVDAAQNTNRRKTALIVSGHSAEIAQRIQSELQRGVTYLQGEGAYQHGSQKVIFCVLTRFEVAQLKQIVLQVDPLAFMTISDTSEVVGRWQPRSPFRRQNG